jgi:signal transduction histidine kinase
MPKAMPGATPPAPDAAGAGRPGGEEAPIDARAAAAAEARPRALFAGVEPIEVFVDLLARVETETTATEFYDRICEAICRLTTMRRAAIFLADLGRRRVRAVGAHGTSFSQLAALRPTLLDTPIAQQALLEDNVVVVSERIEEAVPPEYARLLGITTLVCTPLSAAGRAYGVICADRGGGKFEIADGERHLLWTLGKMAALVATARNATRQQERARRLGERLDLAREVHERVMQRLFGVSLALSAGEPLSDEERERCRVEMVEALADLRRALERPLAPLPRETGTTLATELERLAGAPGPPVRVSWPPELVVPPDLEPLAQSVLAEALRNVRKHARASSVDVMLRRDEATFSLEVRNDGLRPAARSAPQAGGMGLRLAAFEALQVGGVVEFGPAGDGVWRMRLVVPVEPAA